MIDAQTYLEHMKRDGERIAVVADGHLDDPVPTCPGNTVGSMLLHTAGVCTFWTDAMRQNRRPSPRDWRTIPTDPIELHRTMHREFVDELASRDPDQPTWTWGGQLPLRFWYRRSAQEMAVHRWDIENAVASAVPIDPTLAMDGIDELLFVFGPAAPMDSDFKGASERFGGTGQVLRFEPTDLGPALTVRAHPDRFEEEAGAGPNVVARGTASDLLLFVWGRVGPERLDASGDTALLSRWQERVKI